MTKQQQEQIKAPRPERKQSISDWLYERELAQIAAGRAKVNGSNGSEPQRFCSCAELVIGEGRNRDRVPCPKYHDCRYIEARSALVSEAVRIATEKIGDPTWDAQRCHRWTKEFVRQMEKLSAPLLRQSGNGTHEQKAV
jgi:hypothetical protein